MFMVCFLLILGMYGLLEIYQDGSPQAQSPQKKKICEVIDCNNYFTKYIIVDYFDWLVYTGKAKVVKE